MAFSLKFTGDGLPRFEAAVEALGSVAKARAVYRMALNDTNKRIYTQVKRVLATQMGTTQAKVVNHGGVRKVPATSGNLQAEIISRGGYMPLSDFRANQRKTGVSAAPWNTRRIFPKTFIVRGLGGNVFKRVGKDRLPIEKLWGPAVPKEMVIDESKKAFENISSQMLPDEVRRQIVRLTMGAVT